MTPRPAVSAADLLAAIPLALLVGVASFHLWNVKAVDLTPWKGGGFGMFSTADHRPNRFIRTYLVTEQATGQHKEVPVPLPTDRRDIKELARNVRAAPKDLHSLRALATRLRLVRWVEQASPAPPPEVASAPEAKFIASATKETKPGTPAVGFDALRVEVWKLRYAGSPPKLSTSLVAQTTVKAHPSR